MGGPWRSYVHHVNYQAAVIGWSVMGILVSGAITWIRKERLDVVMIRTARALGSHRLAVVPVPMFDGAPQSNHARTKQITNRLI